ncbi:DsbE family thiol:disulfide interchange protein [Alteromonadaceae bacterium BrNp21-10]|nr:DsbE family thiol:disulfide interchange protein [Alteromonadaceae bacterium BrNp21-10]
MKKYWLFIIPLAIFLSMTAFLLSGLFSNPKYINVSAVNRQAPPFELTDVMDEQRLYSEKVFLGEVTLLNVWGTWCVTCAVELPYLAQLRQQGVRIVGLYYELDIDPDFGVKPMAQVRNEINDILKRYGNPYQFNIFDKVRTYSFDLGVTGAPETFVIDKAGVIRMHHIGDINEAVWRTKIEPLYLQLQADAEGIIAGAGTL